MKAEERHRLKKNELAEKFEALPEYLRQHGHKWLTSLLVAGIALGGGLWWRGARLSAVSKRSERLQNLVAESRQLRSDAARQSRSGEQGDAAAQGRYLDDSNRLATSLASLAQQGPGSGLARTALLEEAKLLRSQLYFSDRQMPEAQRESLLDRAEQVYQTILQEYPTDTLAAGTAKLGLALLAEDRGQWDRAKTIYRALLDEAEGRWGGTIFPAHAKDRLALLDEISAPIAFSLEPPKPLLDRSTSEPTDSGRVPGVLDFFMGRTSDTPIDVRDNDVSVGQGKTE